MGVFFLCVGKRLAVSLCLSALLSDLARVLCILFFFWLFVLKAFCCFVFFCMDRVGLAFVLVSFLVALPGVRFAFTVVSSWFVWWFPDKWLLDLFVISFPVLLFVVVLLLNSVKGFSGRGKSVIVTSAALILTQVFFYVFLVSKGFSVF